MSICVATAISTMPINRSIAMSPRSRKTRWGNVEDIPCQNHDYKPAGSHVLHVMSKVCGLLNRASQSNERSLELCEKTVFRPGGIQALKMFFAVKDIDVTRTNTRVNHRLDSGSRVLGVCNGADEPR